jgi:hypothetical protein
VIPRFAVEKVADKEWKVLDIWTVWDAKRNGLNEMLWVPKFPLPGTQDAANQVVKWLTMPVGQYLKVGSPPQDYSQDQDLYIKSFSFDHDVVQQFNNFPLNEKDRHSRGVRFIHSRNDGSIEPQTMLQCSVMAFGCKTFPYLATQGQERIIMEMAEGDPSDPSNPFRYSECYLNLPPKNYDYSFPRVEDGELATRQVTFVDDIHGADRGRTKEDVRKLHES